MILDDGDPTLRSSSESHNASSEGRAQLDALLPAVYDELRRIAHAHLSGERDGHTLNTTALVHESYLRMAGIQLVDWRNRSQFLGMASRAMRRVLIDYARSRTRLKRTVPPDVVIETAAVALPFGRPEDLMKLDDALTRLEGMAPRQCRIVECRFFGGLTNEETAEALAVSPATVKRDWTLARAWLNAELLTAGVEPGADEAGAP